MEYKLYKGYILGLGEQKKLYGMNEMHIYLSKDDVVSGKVWYTAENEFKAMQWLDGEPASVVATQADVDELNSISAGKKYQLTPYGILIRDVCDAIERQAVTTGYGAMEASVSVDQIMAQIGSKGFQKEDVESVLRAASDAGFVNEV